MRLSDQEILEFDELMDALIEETISDEQKQTLQNWLCESKAARRRYIKFMDMNASLQHYAAEFQGAVPDDDPEDPESAAPTNSAMDLGILKPILLIAATLAIGFIIFNILPNLQQKEKENVSANENEGTKIIPDPSTPTIPTAAPVAQLTQAWGLQWENQDDSKKINTELTSGRMAITEGYAQIEFFEGTTIILEGPADIELLSSNSIRCRHGQLRAMIPEQSNGFKVITDKFEILDLGTEFGINKDEKGETEIAVFEGKIQLSQSSDSLQNTDDKSPQNMQKTEYTAGESIFIDRTGKVVKIDRPKSEFIEIQLLRERSIDELRARYEAWLEKSQELREDQRLLLYYTFDDEELWSRTVHDQALNNPRKSDGALVGCAWVQGRWPGKGALQFKRNSDRVKMDVPGEFESVTFSAWLKLDRLNPALTSLILSDSEKEGRPFWQIDADGRLIFSTRGPASNKPFHGKPTNSPDKTPIPQGVYKSKPILNKQLGGWIHLVTLYDGQRNLVKHFVDGKKVSESKIIAKDKISISRVELGNWPKPGKYRMTTGLRGRVDELAIFQTVLTEEEIKEAYEVGKPESLHGWLTSN